MKIIDINNLLIELGLYKDNLTELHIHHTGKPDKSYFNGTNHMGLQEGMKRTHINTNGWSDIGQHLTLFPDGLFVTGRPYDKAPCSSVGYNDSDDDGINPLMVEMLGNFNYEILEVLQLDRVLRLANYFYKQGKPIRFHNEMCATDCPGTSIDKECFMAKVKKYAVTVTDITGHWAEEKIKKVLASGKMVGYADGTFRPDKAITRAELATLIADYKI